MRIASCGGEDSLKRPRRGHDLRESSDIGADAGKVFSKNGGQILAGGDRKAEKTPVRGSRLRTKLAPGGEK